jgi:hypothetical protein
MITLWEDAIPEEKIPAYPGFEYLYAKGGETTYEIDPNSYVANIPFQWRGWKHIVNIVERKAVAGEKLRSPSLRFQADSSKNLIHRIKVQQRCEIDSDYKQLQWVLCKSSFHYFLNTFVWTHDPREKKHTKIPFVSYEFQDGMARFVIKLIAKDRLGGIEKSREQGASWLVIAVMVWLDTFYNGKNVILMSITENEVDDRTESSLFGKARYIISNLPEFMRGGWIERNNICDKQMRLSIPATESKMEGVLTKGTGGVSRRATIFVNDESAVCEADASLRAAQSSLASSGLHLSTPRGQGNLFHSIVSDPGTPVFRSHWTDHPLKNDMWAKAERAKANYDDTTWAQEQEIDYSASTSGRVYPQFMPDSAGEQWAHVQSGDYFEYDHYYPVLLGIDFGFSDPHSVIFVQEKPCLPNWKTPWGSMFIVFEEFEKREMSDEDLADMIIGKPYRYKTIRGDARSGNQRDGTGQSTFQRFQNKGLVVSGGYYSEEDPIKSVRRVLNTPGAFAINSQACSNTISCFQNWSVPVDKSTKLPISGGKPKHDKYSHNMKATAYLFHHLWSIRNSEKKKHHWDFKSIIAKVR